ncbi:MAG: FimB/Mfa2 family fimbrial subunit [Prevotella sp.]|nr:FimB/Mfa2 family fimbrial subunit [Prevotella sp.]
MKHLSLIASALAVLGLTACEKGLDVGEDVMSPDFGQVKNSLLQVRTRGGGTGSEATVAYPVTVYVFQGDECRAAQTIGDEGQTLNIALTEGSYSVYAVGGASVSDYVLPSANDALATSAITLREGHEHSDLMAAQATVTLTDGEANTVTLGMERRTMLLQSVVMKKVPTAATTVSVSVSPLWQSLMVGGNYAGAGGSYTVALEKQSDGRTWQSTATAYLLPPSSSPASITVRITTPSGTRSYTYSTSNELEAGYKISIEGTYTEAVGVTLSGTITGAEWKGERTIRFDFDENGSSSGDGDGGNGNEEGGGVSELPAVGTLYQGCYVLANNGTTATLLSPNEASIGKSHTAYTYNAEGLSEDISNLIATTAVDGISGWRLPTLAELNAIYSASEMANALFSADGGTVLTNARRYFYTDADGNLLYRMLSTPDTSGDTDFPSTTYVRPVTTITKQ